MVSPTSAPDLVASAAAPANALAVGRVRLVHAVAGRVRVKVLGLPRCERTKRRLEEGLSGVAGIRAARASPLTGSLIVRHDPRLVPEAVVDLVVHVLEDGAVASPGSASEAAARRSTLGARSPVETGRGTRRARMRRRGDVSTPENRPAWHALTVAEALSRTESDERGISNVSASERYERDGPNALPAAERRSELDMLRKQFTNLPVGLLGSSAVVSVLTGGLVDAIAIFGVIGINAAIGFATERQSERTIQMLGTRVPRKVPVLRDGESALVAVEEVVRGDVLALSPGTYVAADARVVAASNLSLDESALTGESLPAMKFPEPRADRQAPLADRHTMVHMGTVVTGGNGLGVVVGTGTESEIGAIQSLAAGAERPETPVERQLGRLGAQLAIISGAACAAVFAAGFLRGYGWMSMLKAAISLGAAAVPEGLPAVATTTLALGIRNMQRRKALIRRLDAVEALGSVQMLCLDKTGTLTLNRMSVVSVHVDGRRLRVEGGRFLDAGDPVAPDEETTLRKLLETLALCNEQEAGEEGDGAAVSATERALEEAAIHGGVDLAAVRSRRAKLDVRHRSETRPYLVTVHRMPGGRRLVAVKGAPMQVLAHCDWRLRAGRRERLTQAMREDVHARNEDLAGDGLRVLGVAYAHKPTAEASQEAGLTWLGLVGMADPIRPGMTALLGRFHRAGIDTAMITGDQAATAYAIAKELELARDLPLEMLDSVTLDKMDPELLEGVLKRVRVFARVSPAHKLQIVQALQQTGQVVAMTGDGINDGPALKAADLGIAMGAAGSDIARNIADVVLEDDNLATVEDAIAQGRTIYQNIRKSVRFLLATNMSELSVMTLGITLGLGQPLNPLQLLWINLITDVFPAIALGLDPPEPDILERPPRAPDKPIIEAADFRRLGLESVFMTAGTMASYAWGRLRYGAGPEAQTQAFMSLTYNQLFHCLGCRSEHLAALAQWRASRNDYLLGASFVSSVVQVATMLPPLRGLLGTARLGPLDFLVALAGAAVPFLVNDATKSLGSRGARVRRGRGKGGTSS